ncbi:mechanosensitive ion channel [candidate division GN15 bacterium]|nr:mechanosensitive ion channel [candidate division GN15 bacterium]
MDLSFIAEFFKGIDYDWLLGKALRLALIVVVAFIVLRISKVLVNRLFRTLMERGKVDGEMKKRADTLSSLVNYIVLTAVVAVVVMMVLGQFGVNIGPVLAAAGIVGVAVGFGAQHLVSDVISGFFILIEDQIRVGDVVQIAGQGGIVERVTLRNTVLRDLSGNVHFVRNGQISTVTNMTKDYSYYLFNIGVAYRENTDDVITVVKEVDEDLRSDENFSKSILAPIEILGVDQFADSAVVIKARIKTKPIQQWNVGREFNRRMKIAFDQKGIEIPFPHVTLYMGQDKDGSAPPLHLAKNGNSEK